MSGAGELLGGEKNYTTAALTALPVAGLRIGQRAFVLDATTPTFGGALVGGGAVVVPVYWNGVAWVTG